ncbi:MAG: heme o synthase [Pirellulales bacterium]|nr:heme o synthase [Pirellulales bacterium]
MSRASTNPRFSPSAAALTVPQSHRASAARWRDYLQLAKPRIVTLELIVAAAAACIAAPHELDPRVLVEALAATALVAGSASAANQLLERRVDARMRRTADRPLPAGRVTPLEAAALSAVTLVVGLAWLVLRVNLLTAALGAASWILYVAIYTPLKTRTPLNTAVGAVAGALPLLMGWTATGRPLGLTAAALACVLFLWQFPHFMAIAWLYRRDYAQAGHRMLTVVDPTGVRAGVQAVLGALAILPVSLVPALAPTSGSPGVYSVWALTLGGAQLALAIRFCFDRDDASARLLLKSTLVFLPAWMGVLLMVSL